MAATMTTVKHPSVRALFDDARSLPRDEGAAFKRDLAEQARTTVTSVGRWMNGDVRPHESYHAAIANALGRPIAEVHEACRHRITQPGDEAARLRRVVHAVGRSVESLLQDAVDDGREEYAELLDELRVALRAAE